MQDNTKAITVTLPREAFQKLETAAQKKGLALPEYATILLTQKLPGKKKMQRRSRLSTMLGKERIQRLWDEAMDTSDLLSDEDCRNLSFVFLYSLMHLNLLLFRTRDSEWPAELQGALEMLTTIGNSANIMDGTTILLRKRAGSRKRGPIDDYFSFEDDDRVYM